MESVSISCCNSFVSIHIHIIQRVSIVSEPGRPLNRARTWASTLRAPSSRSLLNVLTRAKTPAATCQVHITHNYVLSLFPTVYVVLKSFAGVG